MSILSKPRTNEEKGDVFIGITVPKEVASYLSMYSLCTGKTKSKIIRGLLLKWKEEKQKKLTINDLVTLIAKKALNIWETNNENGKKENYNTFKKLLSIELKTRGLEKYIDEILNKMINDKNKDK